jgi:anti-sigma B factor antagonist
MTHFAAKTTTEAGRVVVALVGECDLAARDELTSTLLAAVDKAQVLVIDVGALEFLDSSGVHGLVTAHQAAQAAGRQVYLINAGGVVAHVLDMTGVGALLSPPADGSDFIPSS